MNCVAAVLLLLAASVNLFAATSTVVAPLALGVNVAVYTVLLVAEKELREPPLTVISPTTKFDVASLLVKVKVSVASFVVDPLETALPPAAAVIAIVGAVPSYVHVNCVAAVLLLLAASVNLFAATSTVVAPLELGVNVAVYTVLLVAEKELREPPLTVYLPQQSLT